MKPCIASYFMSEIVNIPTKLSFTLYRASHARELGLGHLLYNNMRYKIIPCCMNDFQIQRWKHDWVLHGCEFADEIVFNCVWQNNVN